MLKTIIFPLLLAASMSVSGNSVSCNDISKEATIEYEQPELIAGYATAYKLKGITASGEEVREGICASCGSRLGDAIILYQRLPDNSVGEVIGVYECKDTGGSKAIKAGKLIDVWKPDLDACQEFMNRVYEDGCGGHVWIQVVENVNG